MSSQSLLGAIDRLRKFLVPRVEVDKIYFGRSGKLIRDKIPTLLRRKGVSFSTHSLRGEFEDDDEGFSVALREKIVEEAVELLLADDRADRISEAVDLISVLDAYVSHEGINTGDVAHGLRSLFRTRGGFSKRLVLAWTSNDGYFDDGDSE